jgi:hypothetical protein
MEVPHFILILQTVLLIFGIYVLFRIVSFLISVRKIKKRFHGAKGPENSHWLLGSFVNVSII